MEEREVNHDAFIQLEHPLLKIPYEQLNKNFRTSQKLIEKELQYATNLIGEYLEKAESKAIEPLEAVKSIEALSSRIQSLKKRLNDLHQEENSLLNRLALRLSHLEDFSKIESIDNDAYSRWNNTRLDRIMIDFMLREGYYESATSLAVDSGIQDLVDIELFVNAQKVEDALQAGSCAECLQWCSENKSRLKKMESTLEFNLRLQEYIELIKINRLNEAISYARKHFVLWVDTHLKEIQRAMALLAFPWQGPIQGVYVDLYSQKRWEELIAQFRADNFALYSLTNQPLLTITLRAGLSVLKTPLCYKHDSKTLNCPVCQDQIGELAKTLPFSHHNNSTIVCRITGEIMNEDNLPLVLPNGFVYSSRAMEKMAKENGGLVTCPRTREQFKFSQLKKVFVS